jgi:hypothetical protein
VTWGGTNDAGTSLASGVYFYRIEAKPVGGGEGFTAIKKMVLVK